MAMIKTYNEKEDVWDVGLSGEIDIYNADELKETINRIVDEKEKSIVFDCEELNYIDSTGLGVLASAANRIKEFGGKVRIINLKPHIGKVFYLTGLTRIMEIEVNDQ